MSVPTPVVAIKSATGGCLSGEGMAREVGSEQAPKTALLQWIDVFETGNAELDSWHRKLIEDYNRMLKLLADDAPWPLIVANIQELVENCIEHFQIEQAILEQIGFPRRDQHLAEHRRMELDLWNLVARLQVVDGSQPEHRELPVSFGPSLIEMIIRHDLDYKSYVLHRTGR